MKIILGILLVISVAFNLYQMKREVIVTNDLTQNCNKTEDKLKLTQAAIEKKAPPKKEGVSNQEELLPEVSRVKEPQTLDSKEDLKSNEELAAAYEQDYKLGQKQWRQEVAQFMLDELGLNSQYIDDYFEIRNGREEEISSYLAPIFEKSKNDETYFLSVEDSVSIAKINDFYLNKLKETMGDKAYSDFMKFKRSYNKKMVKNGKGHYFIEF